MPKTVKETVKGIIVEEKNQLIFPETLCSKASQRIVI
jgi:hypothetical protein